MCLYQKFISMFTDTLIIIPDCFLIFWFCIKGNQIYYTWITYTPASLVSIQLLFFHWVKYAETRAFSDTYFPVYGQNLIRTSPCLNRISDIRIRESPYFGIFHSVLLNILSHNLDLREKVLREYMNCLTAPKLKTRK